MLPRPIDSISGRDLSNYVVHFIFILCDSAPMRRNPHLFWLTDEMPHEEKLISEFVPWLTFLTNCRHNHNIHYRNLRSRHSFILSNSECFERKTCEGTERMPYNRSIDRLRVGTNTNSQWKQSPRSAAIVCITTVLWCCYVSFIFKRLWFYWWRSVAFTLHSNQVLISVTDNTDRMIRWGSKWFS